MYLSKRNGTYYLYYQNAMGKMNSRSTRSSKKSEALKFLSTFEVELKENLTKSIPLKNFVFQFLKYAEIIYSVNHWKSLRSTFNEATLYFGNVSIAELTVPKLQEYFNYRLTKLSTYTVKRDIANFGSAFKWGIAQNYLSISPTSKIKKPKLPEKQPLYFSNIEFNQFLLSIDNEDYKDLVMLAVNTGLRQMELLTLTKGQIDLNVGIITLDNRTHVTKSKKIRVVPLNERAKEVLNKRIALDKIFPFSQHQTTKLMRKYRKKSNIRPELTFHSLRHTFASWLVQKGVPILNVSKLLGHSDVKTTQIYAHVSNSELMSSVEMLN
ncbi:MAG: site-specific integrase [Melioribacteraceae bacterium]|jgi:integrase|nr:site-specific integrase [Melioribacteraceae bacterium]